VTACFDQSAALAKCSSPLREDRHVLAGGPHAPVLNPEETLTLRPTTGKTPQNSTKRDACSRVFRIANSCETYSLGSGRSRSRPGNDNP
jgi:hypothetical protein